MNYEFIGHYRHSIDSNGRLMVPKKFRQSVNGELLSQFYMTRGLDGCLYLFPPDEWKKFQSKIYENPVTNNNDRVLKRFFFYNAVTVKTDSMGRVTIPQHLKDYASLQDEVILAGFVSHIEIWNLKRWEEFSQIMNDEEKVNQNLMELGF